VSRLVSFWDRYRPDLITTIVVILAVLATVKLSTEFHRLIWETGQFGAVDLKLRHLEVQRWFDGEPVYSQLPYAVYPPASQLLLWPFLGWLTVDAARGFWAITSVAMLAWLGVIFIRHSGAATPKERVLVVLMLLSMQATGITIGNGQLILHVLPVLLLGVLLLIRDEVSWRTDLLAAALLITALVKPTVSAPFFWIVLLIPNRLRPAILVVVGYLAITLIAASFQPDGPLELFRQWVRNGSSVAVDLALLSSHSSVHLWVAHAGLEEWAPTLSLLVLGWAGLWIYRHRDKDIWLLLGATAAFARLWTYHGLYDNVLVVLPLITLFTISKDGSRSASESALAGVVIAINMCVMLIPARLLFVWSFPWPWVFEIAHSTVWLINLFFIMYCAQVRPAQGNLAPV
jgi:hypothetical protein